MDVPTVPCSTCGRPPADLSLHRDYVHTDNGQRSELRRLGSLSCLVTVCTGEHRPVNVWTT